MARSLGFLSLAVSVALSSSPLACAEVSARTPVEPPTPVETAAPAKAKRKALPQVLQDVEAKYSKAATMQAEFTQVIDVVALKSKKVSSGVIMARRPDKLRWETLKPDMNLLVSDGKHFWYYTPPFDEGEHGQLIERKSSKAQSRLANALLSGSFSVARDMKISQENPSKFLLIPKRGSAGSVNRIEIEIDPNEKLIRKVVLDNQGGNHTEITLSKIELGKKLGDEAFVFVAPPGTDRVKE
jgi:outer membrane lipoprotein carrier protein